jgi:hypothetical protein
MKKTFFFAVLAIVLAVNLCSQVLDKPVATIHLSKPALITINQLRLQIQLLESRYNSKLSGDDIHAVLSSMINNVLIDQAAEQQRIETTDTEIDSRVNEYRVSMGPNVTDEMFLSILESQIGMTYYQFREQIRLEVTRQKYVVQDQSQIFSQITEPTIQEIERFYSRNIQSFIQPETVLLDHIFFVADIADPNKQLVVREFANTVSEQIRSRTLTFQDAVALYSQDAPTKLRSGRIGYITINDARVREVFGDAFIDQVFTLELDAISPVINSLVGLHIVRVAEHTQGRLLQLYDTIPPENMITVADYVKRSLVANHEALAYQTAMGNVVTELKSKADIRIFEEAIADLFS